MGIATLKEKQWLFCLAFKKQCVILTKPMQNTDFGWLTLGKFLVFIIRSIIYFQLKKLRVSEYWPSGFCTDK